MVGVGGDSFGGAMEKVGIAAGAGARGGDVFGVPEGLTETPFVAFGVTEKASGVPVARFSPPNLGVETAFRGFETKTGENWHGTNVAEGFRFFAICKGEGERMVGRSPIEPIWRSALRFMGWGNNHAALSPEIDPFGNPAAGFCAGRRENSRG